MRSYSVCTNMLRFLCHCTGYVVANFSILEIFEIKGWQNDEYLSMYMINTIYHM